MYGSLIDFIEKHDNYFCNSSYAKRIRYIIDKINNAIVDSKKLILDFGDCDGDLRAFAACVMPLLNEDLQFYYNTNKGYHYTYIENNTIFKLRRKITTNKKTNMIL